ncbi:CU044_2847 family protein [Hamadaea tsunoensis]|uniref:CU044_2847 family protein n=1 Tax=Hamadaea tsunoensis TaxID=53368 RepID=UPI000485A546|nr:CU044_2847 family protein [Hamadaea tsunoensis]
MADLVQFRTENGDALIVEVDEPSVGLQRVARNGTAIAEAGQRLEQALDSLRPSLAAVMESIAAMAPTSHEIEFGLKLSGEVGAVVARSTAECHFVVRMQWERGAGR